MSSNITTPSRYSRFSAARVTTRSTPSRRTIRRTVAAAWASLGRLAALISSWRQRSAERRHLHRLNDYMLKDLGISRADVYRETSKRYR